jgi:hypothetical protein
MPQAGLHEGGWRIENWLRDALGDRDHAIHSTGDDFAVYLRALGDAQRFVDAFPELALADGIAEAYGLKEPQRPVQEVWHSIGNGPT